MKLLSGISKELNSELANVIINEINNGNESVRHDLLYVMRNACDINNPVNRHIKSLYDELNSGVIV